jgi:hypothetical protein
MYVTFRFIFVVAVIAFLAIEGAALIVQGIEIRKLKQLEEKRLKGRFK